MNEFKIQIEIEGNWESFTWEQLNEAILFGNDLSVHRKRFWTGIKDKNGKEIYEGDIIQFNTWSKKEVKEVVKFEDGAYMPFFDPHYCDDEQGDHFESSEDSPFEIIGNIYENPDLLK